MIYGKYGEYYNLIYDVKNYDGECESLSYYFKKFSKGKVKSILDVGCGTGNHGILFAEKGYSVVGIDLSEVMINQAKKKVRRSLPVEFFVQDMRDFDLKKKFEAVFCLFGTFGYCVRDGDVVATLRSVRNHLKPHGLLIFDFWPVHTYISKESRQSVREIEKEGTYIIRIMNSTFELQTNVVNLKIKCNVIQNKKLIESFQEEHRVRTFTLPETAHLLKENRFEPLGFFKVDWQTERPYTLSGVDLQTTNVACVAKNSEN
ncbi:MAG: class I SAM-dependent DNA methyltransferase [Candidatus Bathyarchaeia archaeon]